MDKEIKRIAADHMVKAIEHLNHELSGIRTGRASVTLLDMVKIDYYGTPTPIKHVATVSVPDARTISIQPFQQNMVGVIERAILASDLGITPNNDGHAIRLTFPQLTEERRKDIVKMVKKIGEDTRVAVRNVRRDAIEKLREAEKGAKITEDDLHRGEKEIQDITDKNIKEIDEVLQAKEKEVMTV